MGEPGVESEDPSAEAHWESVYSARPSDELGWFEPVPSTLPLVLAHSEPGDGVVDIGGGDSRLVDELIDRGYADLTVVDLSATALARARARLGERAAPVAWLHQDLTDFEPTRTWDLWHDRAVFHFLTTPAQRNAYRYAAARAVRTGGVIVVATFAPDGPESCAGLPVNRYDTHQLVDEFGTDFDAVTAQRLPPNPIGIGDRRPYVAAVLRRR